MVDTPQNATTIINNLAKIIIVDTFFFFFARKHLTFTEGVSGSAGKLADCYKTLRLETPFINVSLQKT